jgi:branched-chain amino acid transport system permease protein
VFSVVALVVLASKNLARTRVGRAFVAVRDNDLAAQVMGINLFYYKLLAFFIGCFLAGISGALLAHYQGYISTENFTLGDSVLYVGMIIIGGLGTAIGPIFGVLFIKLLDQAVQFLSPFLISNLPSLPSGFATGLAPMVFGLSIILFLILQPRGIAHMWNLFKYSYRLWPFSY